MISHHLDTIDLRVIGKKAALAAFLLSGKVYFAKRNCEAFLGMNIIINRKTIIQQGDCFTGF